MRRWRLLALALAIAAGSPAAASLAASDVDVASTAVTGWWSRLNQGDLDLSPANPGETPEDGVSVASAPDGATAIAALRFTLREGDVNPTLTLKVAGTSTNGNAAETVILACHAGAAWTGGGRQDWESKPPAACDTAAGGGSVTGQRSSDGTSWVFPLGVLQLNRTVNIVLVPGKEPSASTSPTFQVSFARPAPGAVATERGTPPPVPSVEVAPLPAAPAPADPSFATAPSLETFVPPLPRSDQVITATAPLVREASPLVAVAEPLETRTSGWVRLLALMQVLAVAGIGWHMLRTSSPDGGDELRGLGPFVRSRLGEAPRL